MGAGASTSLPETIDKALAIKLAGERFDEAAFDKASIGGVISAQDFRLAAAGEPATAAAQKSPTVFNDLGEDVMLELFAWLAADPLRPADAAGLARLLCRGIRSLPRLKRAATALQSHHKKARALGGRIGLTLDRLGTASRLTCSQKKLTNADMATLGGIPLPQLAEVDLRFNEIGDPGLLSLSQASVAGLLPNLDNLELSNNRITAAGAKALAAAVANLSSPAFSGLETFGLAFNKIEGAGMAALATALNGGALPKLSTLALTGNPADDAAVQGAMLAPSDARRESMHGEGGVGRLRLLQREQRGRAQQKHRATASWNIHGEGISVTDTLASSYRDGTLL